MCYGIHEIDISFVSVYIVFKRSLNPRNNGCKQGWNNYNVWPSVAKFNSVLNKAVGRNFRNANRIVY